MTSPSDEVRGLIERAVAIVRGRDLHDEPFFREWPWRGKGNLGRDSQVVEFADAAAAEIAKLAPPSSPVSGEGDEHSVPVATSFLTPDGEVAIAHSDKPMSAETREAVQEIVNATHRKLAPSRPPEPVASGEAKPDAWRWRHKLPLVASEVGWTVVGDVRPEDLSDPALIWEPLYTRPPEGNARAMREALTAARDRLQWYRKVHVDDGPGIHIVNLLKQIDEALALPAADDEAKRTDVHAQSWAERIRAEVIEECALVAEVWLHQHQRQDLAPGIKRAIRALALPVDDEAKPVEPSRSLGAMTQPIDGQNAAPADDEAKRIRAEDSK